jgi:3(or 17)beta-hydroxysteroid dehydrogenase
MARLDGKAVLITGAASGIGRATAGVLAGAGARVALADIDEAGAREAADAIDGAQFHHLDVTDDSGWTRVIGTVIEQFGRLDGLVNGAGILLAASIEDTTLEDWRGVMAVNLDGTFLGCKHGVGAMKSTGGSIVNLSSVSGIVGGHNLAAYNASKGGVRLLTKSVALHCAREGYGIRCNSVHPAFVETPMVERLVAASSDTDRARRSMARQIPLGRIAAPDEVARMILYLISDDSSFVTGAEMVIDGGVTAQ